MKRHELIQELLLKYRWEEFFNDIQEGGFIKYTQLNPLDFNSKKIDKKSLYPGNIMLVNNMIQSAALRDASHLHFIPKVVFRPVSEQQLKKIVITSQKYNIPITFASGKTGLSGAYSNYAITVDLADLHSLPIPFNIDLGLKVVEAEQGVLISDLIKWVEFKSRGNYIFPIQPSSALKLPVRVGGLVSTNASGITSGKLGAAEKWIKNVKIMKPNGDCVTLNEQDSLFNKIIGGEGYYGIILSANFKLCKAPKNKKQVVLFGENNNTAFYGLNAVQESKIFPLISEFIMSPEDLTRRFKNLPSNHNLSNKVRWIVLIKGDSKIVKEFIRIMTEYTKTANVELNDLEFNELLKERASLAILSFTSDRTKDILRIPSFEDILVNPIYIPEIIESLNAIYKEKGFETVLLGYGHLNFRKGQGALLHIRLPLPIEYLYKDKEKHLHLISETCFEVISFLKERYNIKHKAEHGAGPFRFWLDNDFRNEIRSDILSKNAFYNPHLEVFDKIYQISTNALKNENDLIIDDYQMDEGLKKEIFIQCMYLYLIET